MTRPSEAMPVVIVTGGARGIGSATCDAFNTAGYHVVVADVDGGAADAKAAALSTTGQDALSVVVDVSDSASAEAMISSTMTRFARVDVLVNNAGVIDPGPSASITDAAWERMFAVHVDGTYRCSRAAYPALVASGGGAIVNVASIAAHVGLARRLSYSAAKAAVEGIARALAVEWAGDGIRVNAIAPGYTRTELYQSAVDAGLVETERLMARIPLRRPAEPSELASVIVFLSGAGASYITGQTIIVDGGLVIGTDW